MPTIAPTFMAQTGSYGLAGTAVGNYVLASTAFTATAAITHRAITVSANDLSRIYGDANPALTWTVGGMGLVNSDALTGSLATTAGLTSNVGGYAIDQGTFAASGNYAMTFNAGALSVTPRAITVSANDQSRLQGQPDPALTWTITDGSLASFDTTGGVFSGNLARDPGEAVGSYAVPQGDFVANANYALAFLGGVLTISPDVTTSAAMTQSRVLELSGTGLGQTFLTASLKDDDNSDETSGCGEGVLGSPFASMRTNRASTPLFCSSWNAISNSSCRSSRATCRLTTTA